MNIYVHICVYMKNLLYKYTHEKILGKQHLMYVVPGIGDS